MGGDGDSRKTVQFFNKSAEANRLTIEWFVNHNAVCCICRRALDAYETKDLHKHPRLQVIICSECFPEGGEESSNGRSCIWCCHETSRQQVGGDASRSRICRTAECTNTICDRCLRGNFTKTQVEEMLVEWKCFECDPSIIEPHRLYADCLLEFARTFRKPVIPSQRSRAVPTGDLRTRFLSSIRDLLNHVKEDLPRNDLFTANLEDHIKLAQSLRTELSRPQISFIKQEPEATTRIIEPRETQSADPAPPEIRNDIGCSGMAMKSEVLEDPDEHEQIESLSSEEEMLGRITVKRDPEATQPLPRTRRASSDADSNETLRLDNDLSSNGKSAATADDDELSRLLGDVNRRHWNGKDPGIANAQAKKAPARKEKKTEQPFLSSDDESIVSASDDELNPSCSQDDGALTVPSDDEAVAGSSPRDEDNDDNEEDFFNPKERSKLDTSSGEESAEETPEKSSEAKASKKVDEGVEKPEDKTAKEPRRRKSLPAIPSVSTSEPKTAEKKKIGRSKKSGNKRELSSDSESEIELHSDLESADMEEVQPADELDQSRKESDRPAKKKQRVVSLVSDDSESDADAKEKSNDPSPKKFTKQNVKILESSATAGKDTCHIISSDDEDFVQPIHPVPVKTESGTHVGRKNIKELLTGSQLSKVTIEANKREKERTRRIEEMQRKYNDFAKKGGDEGEDVQCILEFDLATKEPLVQVHPQLSRRMKSHQVEGVKFLYTNLVETIAKLREKSPGTGAILGHCMGLGKTFQVVCFLHTLMTHKDLRGYFKTVLVISPLNVIATWQEEISRWVDRDPKITEKLKQFSLHNESNQRLRAAMLSKWQRSGGIMLMTPSLLVSLLGRETDAGKNKRTKNKQPLDPELRKQFLAHLCLPGPNLLIVDEGHTLKRSSTQLTQIVDTMIKTTRKILLTGTPLQNNLTEYYTMVSIVSPHLLGTKAEYRNRFENPITNGQYKNSTASDIRKMRQRASVLKKLLENVVHRRDLSVLQSILPPRHDYVITIRLSKMQELLYEKFLGLLVSKSGEQGSEPSLRRLLQDFVLLRSVWTHPKLLTMPKKTLQRERKNATVADMLTFDAIAPEPNSEIINKDWFKPFVEGKNVDDITLGPKIFVLCDIIQNCHMIGDKLVVFCTQLSALDLVEFLLRIMNDNHIGEGRWSKDIDYFRMDGSTSAEDRHRFFKIFNDPKNTRARLFLVSTNAGKLGSTLVGANRMVLLDTSWNPADDNQAVYRIYRIGQSKPVYIYRFVSFGTMEEKIYARNILKESQSCRVLDDSNMERHFTHEDVRDLYTFTPYNEANRKTPSVPEDMMLAELILRHPDLIANVHKHQQMLQNLEDDMSEEDRRIAWDEYQREKEEPPPQPTAPTPSPMLANLAEINNASNVERTVLYFHEYWRRDGVTDKDRLRTAAPFRNAVGSSLHESERRATELNRTLVDVLKRQSQGQDVSELSSLVKIARDRQERMKKLRELLQNIDQFVARSTQTLIPRDAH
ncbi:transcriptional regulator ATRX [Galendromus occidentalis]|uniref:Transcriptional regulator ATRX n=1 Tax=Galendromus occidentalis TaxID=34638 RepID=A0AAJ6VXH1_9ACAR|nr:transcriptional regulator ATRX [Galendromus occidentalis]